MLRSVSATRHWLPPYRSTVLPWHRERQLTCGGQGRPTTDDRRQPDADTASCTGRYHCGCARLLECSAALSRRPLHSVVEAAGCCATVDASASEPDPTTQAHDTGHPAAMLINTLLVQGHCNLAQLASGNALRPDPAGCNGVDALGAALFGRRSASSALASGVAHAQCSITATSPLIHLHVIPLLLRNLGIPHRSRSDCTEHHSPAIRIVFRLKALRRHAALRVFLLQLQILASVHPSAMRK